MKEIENMKNTYIKVEKVLTVTLLLIFIFYAIGIFVTNFNGRLFYDFDMYSDSLISKKMWEQKTFMPEDWIFGNQHYIIATPNLVALIYGIIGNSFYSMAIASSMLFVLTISAYLFCFGPKLSKSALAISLVCLCGGTLVNTGIATDFNGLQLFFTMASYYSCYLIGLFTTLGFYFKLREHSKSNFFLISLVLLINFGLGMNSIRQTLVCVIPIVIMEILQFLGCFHKSKSFCLSLKQNIKTISFVFAVTISNLSGIIALKLTESSSTMDNALHFSFKSPDITRKFIAACNSFVDFSGLKYLNHSIKYIPLGFLSLFFTIIVIVALILMFKNKDSSRIAIGSYCCLISLLGTFVASVFLLETRSTYYFMWFPLVVLCCTYSANLFQNKAKLFFMSLIIMGCLTNTVYSYTFDLLNYLNYNDKYTQMADIIYKNGIKYIYCYAGTATTICGYSNDNFEIGLVFIDTDCNDEYIAYPVPYIQSKETFTHVNDDSAAFLIHEDGLDNMKNLLPEKDWLHFNNQTQLVTKYEAEPGYIYYLYKMNDTIISGFDTNN